MPLASVGRSEVAANVAARAAMRSSQAEGGTISSTSRQSSARWPRAPSSVAQKMSARSRRTLRLSVSRVSPPVPGSTAKSGTSGSDTDERRSSIKVIQSHAAASS
jgi:hypothetical protein